MTNELKIFTNEEFGQVRTVIVDEKPYFCASDVAKSLGYSNTRDAVSRHCDNYISEIISTNGGNQTVKFINNKEVSKIFTKSKLLSCEEKEKIFLWFRDIGAMPDNSVCITSRKEIEFNSKLNEILTTAKNIVGGYVNEDNTNIITEVVPQYNVLNYKIDFYLPFFHIAIEYDENEHTYHDKYDELRQQEIEKYFEENNSYIHFIRVKENEENKFIGEFIGHLMNFSL
jgi:very-short-patch-repair endonuclease